jgi:hypothetical protein
MREYFKVMILYKFKFYFFKLKNSKNKKTDRFLY